MGFVGRLEDLGVADIFQVLSLGKRTGKLTLTRRKEQALVVFLDGGIVYCNTNTVHEALGSILVNRRLIDEGTLLAALEKQQQGNDRPLGSILVGMGAISRQALHSVVYEQVKTVLGELLSWESGVFQFEPVDVDAGLDTVLDANEFLVEEGLRPEEVVLDLLTQIDEDREAEGASGETDIERQDATEENLQPSTLMGAGRSFRQRGFASLKTIMAELRHGSITFTGEVTLMLLRYMAEVVNRAVLFAVRSGHLMGIGQFGIDLNGGSSDDQVRNLRFPLDESSALSEVASKQEPYRGRLARTSWNNLLVQRLGGMVPREVVIFPVVVDNETVAVIYGDNLPEERPIGPTEGLELLMLQAGLMIEKTRLEARLKDSEG